MREVLRAFVKAHRIAEITKTNSLNLISFKTKFTLKQNIVQIALLIRDYDEAIEFYTKVLHFDLIEDTKRSEIKRWVVIAPPGSDGGCRLLLAKAKNEEQAAFIGNQTGNRVFLFLHTDNFARDLENIQKHQLKIVRGPLVEDFGKVVVFEDLYGNKWDLIEPNSLN